MAFPTEDKYVIEMHTELCFPIAGLSRPKWLLLDSLKQ